MKNLIKIAVLAAGLASGIFGAGNANAIFTNGSFETGDFTGWTKIKGYNNGLKGSPPFSMSSINVDYTYGTELLSTVGSITDPRTDGLLPIPGTGKYSAKINDEIGNNHFNAISQQDTITQADRGSDGKLHVRFSYAAVLEDPQHNPEEQPYFYVLLQDMTSGQTLYSEFTYSNQPGRTFHTSTYGYSTWKWTDWNNIDIVVPESALGHTLLIAAAASDCSLGGHGGYVYIDGFGSQGNTISNMQVSSLSPSTAQVSGQSFTLTINGSGFQSGDVVQWNGLSRATTFVSSSQLTAVILASDIATAGTASVTVNRGTLTSTALSFSVTSGSTGPSSCTGLTTPTFLLNTLQICLPAVYASELFGSGTYNVVLNYVPGNGAQWQVASSTPISASSSATYSQGQLSIPSLYIAGYSPLQVTLQLKSAATGIFELISAR
jgi:hypothetical protein